MMHYLWLVPLECVIFTYVLWLQLDSAGIVGMFVLICLLGLQTFLGKFFGKLRYFLTALKPKSIFLFA